jgi:hypothetical protein
VPHPAFSEVSIAVRVLVGLAFLTAAVGKMRHWSVLRGVVANYRLLPQWLEAAVTYGLPPVEALLGAALLLGQMAAWAAAGAAALLLMFAFAMGINLRRGRRHIDCGCFQSALKQPLSWTLVIRNAVLACLLGIPLLSDSGTGDLAAILLGALAGGVLFLILQSLSILWSIVPAWQLRGAAGAAR